MVGGDADVTHIEGSGGIHVVGLVVGELHEA